MYLPLFTTTLALGLTVSSALAGPRVAVDIAPVHSLVSAVMGETGTPELIVPQSASPHDYSLRPSQAQTLQETEVIFWIGPALFPWMEESIEALAPSATSVELQEIEGMALLKFREETIFEHGDHDDHDDHDDHAGHKDEHAEHKHDDHAEHKDEHSEDHHDEHKDHDHDHDDHAEDKHDDHHDAEAKDDHHGHAHGADGIDPHLWLNPANARVAAAAIRDALIDADPGNASAYRANAQALIANLDTLETELATKLEPVHDASFIVLHDAYQHFEAAFGVGADGSVLLGDATPPGAARLRVLREHVTEHKIKCIFSEPQSPSKIIDTIAENTDLKHGVLDPLGSEISLGPDHYAGMMRQMATAMTGCLSQ